MRFSRWRGHNRIELLVNGQQFYPHVFAAIESAQAEVIVETFIVQDDRVGGELQRVLIEAARRGVRTELIMDGYGSEPLPQEFIAAMTDAGVRVKFFDPQPRWFGWRINIFRRLHRKLVVVDGRLAFVGGINYSDDHIGPPVKQDYAVEVEGPVVRDIHMAAGGSRRARPPRQPRAGGARALFVTRDNQRHHNDIELQYLLALRAANRRVIIANAYFFPGYRLLRELYAAAQRGVQVDLIMQGNPDLPLVRWCTSTLYDDMRRAGIRIHEFREGPLHGKIACVDDDWSTVGSSNLDPLSLFLNIEGNLFVRDRAFAAVMEAHCDEVIERRCEPVREAPLNAPRFWRQLLGAVAFHVLRRFPRWAGWLPGRRDLKAVPVSKNGLPSQARDNKEIAHGT